MYSGTRLSVRENDDWCPWRMNHSSGLCTKADDLWQYISRKIMIHNRLGFFQDVGDEHGYCGKCSISIDGHLTN